MKPSGEALKDRFTGFLIWESILSSTAFLPFATLRSFLYHGPNSPSYSASSLFLTFLAFIVSNLLFSVALHAVSSPLPVPAASPSQLLFAFFRTVLFTSSSSDSLTSKSFRRNARVTALLVSFVMAASISGLISVVSITGCGLWKVAIRGCVCGVIYSLVYVYKQRWVLQFPIVQRPLFFSFKLGIFQAMQKAFKLSNASYFISAMVLALLHEKTSDDSMLERILEQVVQYAGIFSVFLSWELSHHLHQVLHTRRLVFAPSRGSAAAETNPSEALLSALEESTPGSLVACLAYLDLCMVCENNVYNWRRAAFFEETSETYKRVIAVCLRPLEHFSSNLAEVLDSPAIGKGCHLSNQMLTATESIQPSNLQMFNNVQQCAWGARAAASLTACSHRDDRFGIAQLSGSNAEVISTLISSLLAVEALMGKKTNLHPPNQFMGPAGIKWATQNTLGKIAVSPKLKNNLLHAKAYAIADVLRASIYCIVSSFHEEMLASSKSGRLEKDWIITENPLYGSRELLLQKLYLFLDFRAS